LPTGVTDTTGVPVPVVCVVGAGTAGLESLLSAREQLGAGAELRLIAPDRQFRYRPMSPGSLFRPAPERGLAIADLVAQVGATWVADRADVIYEEERKVLTRDGDTVDFDFLLLAMGARSRRALSQGHVWERGADPGFLDRIIEGIAAGEVRSVAVAVPRGARWPIPAYELALVLAWRTTGTDARVTLLTAEERPLGALGRDATEAVERELDAAGVEVVTSVEVVDDPERSAQGRELADVLLVPGQPADGTDALMVEPSDPARVRLGTGSSAEFERLISLPTVVGPFINGVATDAVGLIEVDDTLKVCGSERVWAAGGCIAAALEHSALSARQADAAVAAIAASIAGEAGAGLTTSAGPPDLTGLLLTGAREQWLAENPLGTHEPSTRCLWWPPGRAVGHMLAQRIAAWDPSVHRALGSQPGGLEIRAPVALGCSERASVTAGSEVSAEVRAARLSDIENRQQMALQRREREAAAELQTLSTRLQTFATHQREVISELEHHGYLRDIENSAADSR
jgi:sulfide:quinone oxidoreductase